MDKQYISNQKELLTLFYFNLKNAYIDNDKDKINFFLKSLLKAIDVVGEEEAQRRFKPCQIKDLQNIFYCIQHNINYTQFNKYEESEEDLNTKIKNDAAFFLDSEKELEKLLIKKEQFDKLNNILNMNMKIVSNQFEVDCGKVDILAQDDRLLYIIELKKDIADHKIIGQLIKYSTHFQKRLIYNLYDYVEIITIAGDYNEFTYRELKKMNVVLLTYSYINNEINFKKV